MEKEYREYVVYVDDRRFEYNIEVGSEPSTDKEWYYFTYNNAVTKEGADFVFSSEHIKVYVILPSIGDGLLVTEFNIDDAFAEEKNEPLVEEHKEEGVKYDHGKPMPGTAIEIFPRAIMEVGRCIEYGTHKYPDVRNWEKLEDADRRYKDALMRHIIKHIVGSEIDTESGIYHLAHVAWNALALCELFLKDKELEWDERNKKNDNKI